jgi:hypothetical protein
VRTVRGPRGHERWRERVSGLSHTNGGTTFRSAVGTVSAWLTRLAPVLTCAAIRTSTSGRERSGAGPAAMLSPTTPAIATARTTVMAGGRSCRDLFPHRAHRPARHDSSLTVWNPRRRGTALQGPWAVTPSDREAGRAGRTTGSRMLQSTSLSSRHTRSSPMTGYAAANGGSPPLSDPTSLNELAPAVLRFFAGNSRRSPGHSSRRRDGRSAWSKTRRCRYSDGSEGHALPGRSHISSLGIWCRCPFPGSPRPRTRCGRTASCCVSWTAGNWLAAAACGRSPLPDLPRGSEPRCVRSSGAAWSRSCEGPTSAWDVSRPIAAVVVDDTTVTLVVVC